MWLYRIFVTLCVIKFGHFAATSIPSDSNKKTPSSPINDNDLNGVKDDDYYTPVQDWSDTFDWRLLKAVAAKEPINVLVSPLSLKLVLVMLYEGASGMTEKQFQSVMQFPPNKTEIREKYKSILHSLLNEAGENTMSIGTRLFLESSITPQQQFSASVKDAYETDIYPTNFSAPVDASNSINSWVNNITKGHIKDLISPDDLTEDVLLVVANALYFKGLWEEKFLVKNTQNGGFYVTPKEIITVPYMSISGKYFAAESKDLDAKILRVPYKGNKYAMYFILPNTKGGLKDLLENINLPNLKRQLFLMDNRTVDIAIPKFKFEFGASYSKILEDMGLTAIFSNTASLPAIARGVGSGTKFLFVNDIKQKAGIEINEEGSEIYAATEVQLGSKIGDADIIFNATHPFLIFVEDRLTGSILFAGKVVNPLQSDPVSVPSRFGEGTESSKPVTHPTTPSVAQSVGPSVGSSVGPSVTSAPVCHGSAQHYNPQDSASQDVASSSFDLKLLQAFDEKKNYFLSPASIKLSLAMLREGAKGVAANEIDRALNLDRSRLQDLITDINANTNSTKVESANAAFISNTLSVKQQFRATLENHYQADLVGVDFNDGVSAANTINNWVRTATHELIPELVSADLFRSGSSLVIANALYFNGLWKNVFDEKTTSITCFTNHRKNCISARMMQTIDTFNYKQISSIGAQALQLLYDDRKYAMLVLLPNEKHSVDGLIQDLQRHSFDSVVKQLESTEVFLKFPKFEIEYSDDLVAILQGLNIHAIFGENSDLSDIAHGEKLKVSKVIHKAKVQVNERGTIAAAASGVNVVPLMGSSMPRFVADRPFLFFIYQVQSNNILFAGRFNEPPNVYDEIFAKPSKPAKNKVSHNQAETNNRQEAVPLSTDGILFPTNTKTPINAYQNQ